MKLKTILILLTFGIQAYALVPAKAASTESHVFQLDCEKSGTVSVHFENYQPTLIVLKTYDIDTNLEVVEFDHKTGNLVAQSSAKSSDLEKLVLEGTLRTEQSTGKVLLAVMGIPGEFARILTCSPDINAEAQDSEESELAE